MARQRPQDGDGDGVLTVLDAYKFAGVHSNQQLIEIKSLAFVRATQLTQAYLSLITRIKQDKLHPPITMEELKEVAMRKIELDATETVLQGELSNIYLHQEPWLLHADLARRLVVSL